MANVWNRPLIKKYGKVMAFKDLPMEAKMALVWYMAVEGEAWELNCKATKGNIEKNMDYFDKTYGKKKFGLAFVPSGKLKEQFLKGCKANEAEWENPKTIEGWLHLRRGIIPNHKQSTWPSIFGDYNDDNLFQDGWHRFSCYLKNNKKVIPCLYYIK